MTGLSEKAHKARGMKGFHFAVKTGLGSALLLALAGPAAASQDVELKVTKGMVALRANDLTAAEELFQAALTQDAGNEDAHYFLGQLYNRQQRYPDAVSHLTQVDAALWPMSFDLGLAYYGSGQYGPAVDWLEDAVKRKENLGQAQFYLGLAHYKLGQYSDAQEVLLDATRAGLPATLDSYALLYLALAQQRTGDAAASSATAAKLKNQYPASEAAKLAANLSEDLASEPAADATAPAGKSAGAGKEAADAEKPEKDRFMRFKLILGAQYDTNPALVQDDITARQFADPRAVDDPAAWRSTYDFGLGFNFVRRPKFRWSVDGGAYLNTHYGFLDKAYLNFAREEARSDFGVYIGKWALLFGGGYNAVQSEVFNFDGIEEKAANAIGGEKQGLTSFLWQSYSEGIPFYTTFLYQLTKVDSIRAGVDGSVDTFASVVTGDNPRDSVMVKIPMGYTRVLLPKLGLAVDGDLTPGLNRTLVTGSQYSYWLLGLDAGVRINPVKIFQSGLVLSFEHRGYQSEMVDPLVRTPQFRADNDLSAMLYAGIKAGAFVLNASTRFTTHKSNMEIFAYKRAIHGFSLGFKL